VIFSYLLPAACHVIVNAIDQWLAENKTVAYLDGKLEVVCAIIKPAEAVVRYSTLFLLLLLFFMMKWESDE
jgi:hypothetical protein